MTNKYQKLLTPLTFQRSGVTIPARTALSPMLSLYGEKDGTVGQTALNYFGTRSKAQGLLITGASYVSEYGFYDNELGLNDDKFLPGLTKLAQIMKKDGNKAIVQLHHAGKQASGTAAKYGFVQVPSKLPTTDSDGVPTKEMSEEDIENVINDFASATKRVIKAGFDGVEIHGANWYLLHEFFSPLYNQRTDNWGGSLEKRMRFPLAVVKAVKKAAEIKPDFIIGFRMTPEENMPSRMTANLATTKGYSVEDGLKLANKLADLGIDYIHYSLFSKYDVGPEGSSQSYGQMLKEAVGDRVTTIISSGVHTADDALDALNHGDIIAIGRESLVEPEFTEKIKTGNVEQIRTEITRESAQSLAFPDALVDLLLMKDTPFLVEGRENLTVLKDNKTEEKPVEPATDTTSGASN
ncbi:NADH-dependent oxidoreductase [Lactobacillus sp. ESL0791]|uniref:oxidoreductase n=1 Tax=Lactobacillus sp. ESL0791 TaxID=2983234 RepID=UPI0023F98EFC|nr:NADH-dependent oxidoreductase [Lactobacillus sp. ESL0791]MDF7638199.1 NADH-dependent oxidoreductase [Lactobacillus sp. ESL0791]